MSGFRALYKSKIDKLERKKEGIQDAIDFYTIKLSEAIITENEARRKKPK